MKRTEFHRVINAAKPALAGHDYVPIFRHFCFTGDELYAYNDIIAITLPCKAGFTAAVPGPLLLGLVGASNAKDVEFNIKDDTLHIKAGVSRWALPILHDDNFVFEKPAGRKRVSLVTDERFFRVLDQVTAGANRDEALPEQHAVTVSFQDDIYFYSTDTATISYYLYTEGNDTGFTGDVVLPLEFCSQLLAHRRAFIDTEASLNIYKGHVTAEYEGYSLFAKLVTDVPALEYRETISESLVDGQQTDFVQMPRGLPAAVERAAILMNYAEEGETTLIVDDDSRIRLHTRTNNGEARDLFKFPGHETIEVQLDPRQAERAVKTCSKLIINERCIVMTNDDGYGFLISLY